MDSYVRDAVRKLRQDMHLSQTQFAAVLGVTNVSVCRWECGKPVARESLEKLAHLADQWQDTVRATLFRMAMPVKGRRRAANA